MNARVRWIVAVALVALLRPTLAPAAELADAWTAWENGNIHEVEALVDEARAAGTDDAASRHLQFLVRYVTGNYEAALELYETIPAEYDRLGELDAPYVEACRHLGRYAGALAFAKERGMSGAAVSMLELQANACSA